MCFYDYESDSKEFFTKLEQNERNTNTRAWLEI
jgi:hypothetical protein